MSRGGSRYGAGRPASHAKTSETVRIGVRDLKRNGALDHATANVTLTWQSGASIRVHVEGDSVTLSYRYKFSDGWREISQRVSLERTPCHYGGARLWFRCPRCSGRAALLYLRGWPGCRRCSRLVYPSQSEDAIGRSWGRTHKLEGKLSGGAERWNYRKPKGMRRATYKRLRDAYWREEEVRDEALALFVARMGWPL